MMLVPGPHIAYAEPTPVLETADEREAYAREVARKYEIHEERFVKTLACESIGFTWNDQSLVKDPKGPNGREPSYGIAQFYMPSGLTTASGREITLEVALDPRQAIDAAGFNFSIGNAKHWTCFRNL